MNLVEELKPICLSCLCFDRASLRDAQEVRQYVLRQERLPSCGSFVIGPGHVTVGGRIVQSVCGYRAACLVGIQHSCLNREPARFREIPGVIRHPLPSSAKLNSMTKRGLKKDQLMAEQS